MKYIRTGGTPNSPQLIKKVLESALMEVMEVQYALWLRCCTEELEDKALVLMDMINVTGELKLILSRLIEKCKIL